MQGVFPEALTRLRDADPELFSIIEDEKERQWCAAVAQIYAQTLPASI